MEEVTARPDTPFSGAARPIPQETRILRVSRREKLGPAVGLRLGLLLWLESLVLFVNKGENEEEITLNSVPTFHPRKVPFTKRQEFPRHSEPAL